MRSRGNDEALWSVEEGRLRLVGIERNLPLLEMLARVLILRSDGRG